MSRPAKWITLEQALETTGNSSAAGLAKWIDRWNRNLDNRTRIERRYGKVDETSLLKALEEDKERYGKAARSAKEAYLALASGKPRRTSSAARKGEMRA